MKRLFILLIVLCASLPAFATGGTCPGAANYVNPYATPNSVTTLAAIGVTSCYYVAANGADTNDGLSEAAGHPFLHAPGMSGCTSNCAAATTSAGTGFIFRGGDAWHYGNSAASPYQNGNWVWAHSGTSVNPIYIGVDQGWYVGASFARPVFTGDNPAPTYGGTGTSAGSFVSACTFDNSALSGFVQFGNGSVYNILDGIEFSGYCWLTGSGPEVVSLGSGTSVNNAVTRNYFHAWSTNGTTDGTYAFYEANTGTTGNIFAMNVVDGSDSSYGASTNTVNCKYAGYSGNAPCYTGGGIYEGGYDIHGNVFRHLSDVAVTTASHVFYSNWIDDIAVTSQAGGQHSNCNNMVGNTTAANISTYSNLVTNYAASECFYFAPPAGHVGYFFNNVFWGNMNVGVVGTFPTNCILLNVSQSAGTAAAYLYQNTWSQTGGGGAGCQVQLAPSNSPLFPWNGPVYFANNHGIGSTTLSGLYSVNAGASCNASTCPITDNGGEVFETEAAANSQGYTTSNNYAPTAATNPTVGAGTNYTSVASTFSADSSLAEGTNWAAEQAGWGGKVAIVPGVNGPAPAYRPTTGAWDSGAYEYVASGIVATGSFFFHF